MSDRLERIHRIAELLARFRPRRAEKGDGFKVFDIEKRELMVPGYESEDMAAAGARLFAAYEVDAFYDGASK